MMAIDLTKYMVCIILGILLVNSLNIFPQDYIPADSSFIDQFNYLETSNYAVPENPSVFDYALISFQWLWQALLMLLNIILIPVTILPWLISAFGIPPIIGTMLGVFTYFIIVIAIIQWYSGKSTGAYE